MTHAIYGLCIFGSLLAIGLLGPLRRPRCGCGAPATRIIHMGVPMWFCFADEHTEDGEPFAVALGWLSGLLGTVLPWNGWMCPVSGPYLVGLWEWWQAMGCTHGEEE